MVQIETRKIEEEYSPKLSAYGIEEFKVLVNGQDIRRKLITYNGKPVPNFVSNIYRVLPNEEALKVADEVARQVGAVPFDKFTGKTVIKKSDSHVVFDNENRFRMHALYAFNEPVEIKRGDAVQLGISINNSIDGKGSFGASLFTFRQACKNLFWHAGLRHDRFERPLDQRSVLAYIYKAHFSTLNTEAITNAIKQVLVKGIDLIEDYKAMTKMKLLEEQAKEIANRLPKKMIKEAMPYIKIDDENDKVTLTGEPTIWESFNDATGYTWHNNTAQLGTKLKQMKVIEQVYVGSVRNR